MKTLTILLCLLSTVAPAQDVLVWDRPVEATVVVLDAGVAATAVTDPFNNPIGSVKDFYVAVKTGNYWWAGALLLFVIVGLLRMFGKKVHAWLADTNPLDKPFWFLFDTKMGGWLLNWLTSIGLVLAGAQAAGVPVDFGTWKSALVISTTGTALIELWKDIKEWWDGRTKKLADEAAAKVAVVAPKV